MLRFATNLKLLNIFANFSAKIPRGWEKFVVKIPRGGDKYFWKFRGLPGGGGMVDQNLNFGEN